MMNIYIIIGVRQARGMNQHIHLLIFLDDEDEGDMIGWDYQNKVKTHKSQKGNFSFLLNQVQNSHFFHFEYQILSQIHQELLTSIYLYLSRLSDLLKYNIA